MSNESFYNGCMISLKNMNWSMMMSQEQKYEDIVEYGRNQIYKGQNENDKILPSNAFDGGWCLGVNYQPPTCEMCGDGREEMPFLERVREQIRQTCYHAYGIYEGLNISVYCQWMNWTEPHGYAISHIHGSTSMLTGAYFVDIPENSRHRVGTNQSDKPRISLAFDLKIG